MLFSQTSMWTSINDNASLHDSFRVMPTCLYIIFFAGKSPMQPVLKKTAASYASGSKNWYFPCKKDKQSLFASPTSSSAWTLTMIIARSRPPAQHWPARRHISHHPTNQPPTRSAASKGFQTSPSNSSSSCWLTWRRRGSGDGQGGWRLLMVVNWSHGFRTSGITHGH